MELTQLLDRLGYTDSPHFLRRGTAALRTAPEFGHIFRKATEKPCLLEGVYTLRRTTDSNSVPLIPVVYVCRAKSKADADQIHKLIWNQDIVPFILVHTPDEIRLYSGFRCEPKEEGQNRGVLRVLTEFNKLANFDESFDETFGDIHADAIDRGQVWRNLGKDVTGRERVDRKLLENLKQLDRWLRSQEGIKKEVSHALIGKYVYLHYLRDREILSRKRLEEWDLNEDEIFGPKATRAGLKKVTQYLDAWLNGSVFPLKLSGKLAPDDPLIGKVASIFSGNQIVGNGNETQLHLGFGNYDFSYIPIETLSVIYEQFLHLPEEDGNKSKGKKGAAYYTPIPVVNFMLAEMDECQPLQRGMKVFDPACGSGAFLVQSYRRLIERVYPATRKRPTPQQLRELLEAHIFGMDYDPDACSVTELSLILTLLDYVDPEDLLPATPIDSVPPFQLPTLRDSNIFHTDFFQLSPAAIKLLETSKFDWVVGNPPWKELVPAKLDEQDKPVWDWMYEAANKKLHPCGGNGVAQAFAWRVRDLLSEGGVATLLLPAMMLFADESTNFRKRFFGGHHVTAVANFSNLARDLFAGRVVAPAAAFFWRRLNADCAPTDEGPITVFSPLVANQELTRPDTTGTRNKRHATWNLTLCANELREISQSDAATGSGLFWKIASWGSNQDLRLLRRMSQFQPAMRTLEKSGRLTISEGLQLRTAANDKSNNEAVVSGEWKESDESAAVRNGEKEEEAVVSLPEVAGKRMLVMKTLAGLRHVFRIEDSMTSIVPKERAYYRKRGGGIPIAVCRPPHIIVSEARTFAVYTDEYLIVPPGQIGIASNQDEVRFLKALSLFLSSDFVLYHQFLTSTHFGVKRDVATLKVLRSIPVPIAELSAAQLKPWVDLHGRLLKTSPLTVQQTRRENPEKQKRLFDDGDNGVENLDALLKELNELVSQSLGLSDRERALVHDLVHIRRELTDGKMGSPAVRPPKPDELKLYSRRLKKELDAFIDAELDRWHQVGVVYDKGSGSAMIQVDLIADKDAAKNVEVMQADKPTATQLETTRQRLRKQHSQWVYFDRNLRIYEGTKTFFFKPLQRFHWTESQAMQDASEIIAETLQGDDQPL